MSAQAATIAAPRDYGAFLADKWAAVPSAGLEVPPADLSEHLFAFQREIVSWTLARGRAAIFAATGLGKTLMELEFGLRIGGRVLILAPLAVSRQIAREGEKFGVPVTVAREITDLTDGINVTNYQRLGRFLGENFDGLVLDESGILKAMDGQFRKLVTEFGATIPARLCATATPAPNDWQELGQHAEFLGACTAREMMALYFTQDGNSTTQWRLKGHAVDPFWRWVASWAVAANRPGDVGHAGEDAMFDLPPLTVQQTVVESHDPHASGTLFAVEARTLSEHREARRRTLDERVAATAALVAAEPDEQWLLWCDLNVESEALAQLIPGAVEVKGADSDEHKETTLLGFAEGDVQILVSKPSVAGFGMNFQSCARVVFVGLSHSFERYFQAIRRCWRFGQTREVKVWVVTTSGEGAVVRNIERKERQAAEMMERIIDNMNRTREHLRRGVMEYETEDASGEDWTLLLGDCVERLADIEAESVGLTLFSPPFPTMYAYTDSPRDMGNVTDVLEMIEQFEFLLPELHRVLMPGRSVALHLAQAQTRKRDGDEIGLKDFRGATIAAMERAGFTYYGEAVIQKDPQVKAVRTKDRGLLFKTLASDSAHMRMAQADYLLQFRKPGVNPRPIRAGISEKYDNPDGWITQEEWIEWAHPIWLGIRETDVLNVSAARDERDERHLCPLQLGVIERAVKLWSAPRDLVLSPFAGVGSEGVGALRLDRRFVGCELKRSYFETARRNLEDAVAAREQQTFDFTPEAA